MSSIMRFKNGAHATVLDTSTEREVRMYKGTDAEILEALSNFKDENLENAVITSITGDTTAMLYNKYLKSVVIEDYELVFKLEEYSKEALFLKDVQKDLKIQSNAIAELANLVG